MTEEVSVESKTEAPSTEKPQKYKDGDFILLNSDMYVYTAENTETLVMTTSRELAEKEKIFSPEMNYKPEVVCFGRTKLLPKVEEVLRNAETGKTYEIVLEPADAYGERKAELIRTFPLNQVLNLPEFRDGRETLEVGKTITIRDENGVQREGKIVTVTAGRVRIDFNHPYAGKKVKFKMKVEKALHTETEKIGGLIEMVYGTNEGFEVEVHGVDAKIKVPERAILDLKWVTAKARLILEIKQRFKTRKVIFTEEYLLRKEEEKKEEKQPETEKKGETENKQ
ncbi:MAG: hypothetical protein N3F63_04345 [Thermoplasmata archaeon]|nr:hypothetical protein [Thermoplasmata archaeon]